jgi:hypothetical protein
VKRLHQFDDIQRANTPTHSAAAKSPFAPQKSAFAPETNETQTIRDHGAGLISRRSNGSQMLKETNKSKHHARLSSQAFHHRPVVA